MPTYFTEEELKKMKKAALQKLMVDMGQSIKDDDRTLTKEELVAALKETYEEGGEEGKGKGEGEDEDEDEDENEDEDEDEEKKQKLAELAAGKPGSSSGTGAHSGYIQDIS